MARNTHVVTKAQRQLDEVTGGERLPVHSDVHELPYITAIIKEIFRWAPPVPLGVSHRLMEDDVYKGMFIPAGAMVIENIWWVRPSNFPMVPHAVLVGGYAAMRRRIPTRTRLSRTGS